MSFDPTSLARCAYATLRFTGDDLDPHHLSALFALEPTEAWRKGDLSLLSGSEQNRHRKIGMWLLKTSDYLDSKILSEHIGFVETLIGLTGQSSTQGSRFQAVQATMATFSLQLTIMLFWHGMGNASDPRVPSEFIRAVQRMGGSVKTDFAVDEPETVGSAFTFLNR